MSLAWAACIGITWFIIGATLAAVVMLYAAPGLMATKPVPNDRAAWIDTSDGLSRCYYSTVSANWMGCVRK